MKPSKSGYHLYNHNILRVVILVVVVVVVGASLIVVADAQGNNHNDYINSLIERHYHHLMKHPHFNEEQHLLNSNSGDGSQNKEKRDKYIGYECHHGTVMRRIMDSRNDTVFKEYDKQQQQQEKEKQEKEQHKDIIGNSKLLQDNNSIKSNRQPIRIGFNTDTILNGDQYSCTSVDQKVRVGGTSQPTVQACSDSIDAKECIYTCKSNDILTADISNYVVHNVLGAIKEILNELIRVDQVSSNLVLDRITYEGFNRQCDYGVPIPSSYISTGIPDIDFIIFVTIRPTPTSDIVAYAAPCNFKYYSDNFYGRPLASIINLNPSYINPTDLSDKFKWYQYIHTVLHECTHALGFTTDFYDSYVDGSGRRYSQPYKQITVNGVSPYGQSYSYKRFVMTTPAVKAFAKAHYQCDSLEWVELEDMGATGTVGSHWEKRIAGEEYMIGYVQGIQPITNLTLALLQDTGWYDVNSSISDSLVWGKNLGCSWERGCSSTSWQYQGYWCSSSSVQGCSATRMGKGKCGIFSYKSLPPQYQHFPEYDSNVGGDEITDGCPYTQVPEHYLDGSSIDPNTFHYCVDESKSIYGDSNVFEVFGSGSRCFEREGGSGMACWRFQCLANDTVSIQVGNDWVNCTTDSAGQKISVGEVTVICPYGFSECGGSPITYVPSNAISNYNILTTTITSSFIIIIIINLISIYILN